MQPVMRRTSALLVVALAVGACSSSNHIPRDPRKVYRVMQNGRPGYMRNGMFHADSGFGGGLADAVTGNPQAEAAAETFRSNTIGGFIALLGGSLCVPSVFVYGVVRAEELHDTDRHVSRAVPLAMLGCTALMIVGAGFLIKAAPYQFDAVNIYNDDVDAQPIQWPPPPGPNYTGP